MGLKKGDNPHIWYNLNMPTKYVNYLVKRLSKLDKKHAAYFKENGQKYLAKINKIKKLAKSIDGKNSKPVFVSEPVFDYALEEAGYRIGDKEFEEAVENLKTYISERIPRLDEKKFLNYDPEAASVILPVADSNSPIEAELVISGSCVSLANGGTFSIYTADGRLCFEGNGTTSPLASGVYIIRTPEGGSAKFSI